MLTRPPSHEQCWDKGGCTCSCIHSLIKEKGYPHALISIIMVQLKIKSYCQKIVLLICHCTRYYVLFGMMYTVVFFLPQLVSQVKVDCLSHKYSMISLKVFLSVLFWL